MGASRKAASTGLVRSMRKVNKSFVAIALGAIVVLAGCSSSGLPVASAESQAAKSEPVALARPETSQEQAITRYDIYKLKRQQQLELARQERIAKQKEKEKKEAERRRNRSHGSHGSPPINLLGT